MLTIDNADRGAPAQYANDPVLEVVRRIDRGAGSTFRINGREVRARDVQLLFADASTGANSPALVRQGQVSELIAAKPQNRRLILEEAAGVSGLHGRRHEAELRLRAAEANLARLSDLGLELETALGRLKREARQAERFKRVSAEIRRLQSALLFVRWADAAATLERAEAEAGDATRLVEAATLVAAAAQAAAIEAQAALAPRREEAQTRGRGAAPAGDRERPPRARGRAGRGRDRAPWRGPRAHRGRPRAREPDRRGRHRGAGPPGRPSSAALEAEALASPERVPELTEAWRLADARRAGADAEVERLAALAAEREADRRGAETRLADAESRVSRNRRALEAARERPGADLAATPIRRRPRPPPRSRPPSPRPRPRGPPSRPPRRRTPPPPRSRSPPRRRCAPPRTRSGG